MDLIEFNLPFQNLNPYIIDYARPCIEMVMMFFIPLGMIFLFKTGS